MGDIPLAPDSAVCCGILRGKGRNMSHGTELHVSRDTGIRCELNLRHAAVHTFQYGMHERLNYIQDLNIRKHLCE